MKTAPTQDPKGGLSAAGRRAFAKSEGAHLKPGVRKPIRAMTIEEMRCKGSWAVRFFGRTELPPLQDQSWQAYAIRTDCRSLGRARAENEIVGAPEIAEKGKRLLARYQREKKAA